ncbi:hypothetical protein M595_4949 [Lyngbya aestuarii BL J]|uniref:Uncharacterized protein n=1 Tax=Lyngbya aestuarii BL J TaxID=1348334 RepID=U7QD19_9CYAN|nr:hypothetical protein M595_4949 [Lyngbya aestuarii BL J]
MLRLGLGSTNGLGIMFVFSSLLSTTEIGLTVRLVNGS